MKEEEIYGSFFITTMAHSLQLIYIHYDAIDGNVMQVDNVRTIQYDV